MHRITYRWAVVGLALTLALAALPTANAHAVVTVLDTEIHLLQDAGDDSYALIDGYDLVTVYGREAWFAGLGEGMAFRFVLYGGFNSLLPPQADVLGISFNFTAGGASHSFWLNTTDGANWTSDMTLLDVNLTGGPLGENVVLEAFVSQAQIGVARGATLSGFRLASYADREVLDIVPGGRFLAGAEIPEESAAVTPSVTLRGPFGYTSTDATLTGDRIGLAVTNLITVQEQHILMDIPPVSGWTVDPPAEAGYAVLANESVSFSLGARAIPGSADLLLYVISDLGGREKVTLSAPPPPPTPPPSPPPPEPPAQIEVERPPEPEPEPPMPDDGTGDGAAGDDPDPSPESEDTGIPGVGVGLLLAAVAVAALVTRRRR